jgi:hypothetical protein
MGILDDLSDLGGKFGNALFGTSTPNYDVSPSTWDMSGWGNDGQDQSSLFGDGKQAQAGGPAFSLPKIDTQTPTDWSQAQPTTTKQPGLLSRLGSYIGSPEGMLAIGTALRAQSNPNAFQDEASILNRWQASKTLQQQQANQAAKDAAIQDAWTTDADGNQSVDQNAYMRALQKRGYTGDYGAALNEAKGLGDAAPTIEKDDQGNIYVINPRRGTSRLIQAGMKPITMGADQTVIFPPGYWQGRGGPPGAAPGAAGGAPATPTPGGGQPPPAGAPGAGFNAAVQGREGAGQNPFSSASGVGQFLGQVDPTTGKGTGTWFDVMRNDPQFAPLIQGKTDAQILALRQNPQVATAAINSYANMNRQALQRAGIANPTDAQLGMAHGFGAGGALKILASAPNTPIENIIGAHTAAINRLTGQNAGQVVASFNRRFGQGGGQAPATMAGGAGSDQIAGGGGGVSAVPGMPGWTMISGPGKQKAGQDTPQWLTPQEKVAQGLDPSIPVYRDNHGNFKTLPGVKTPTPVDPAKIDLQIGNVNEAQSRVADALSQVKQYNKRVGLNVPFLGHDWSANTSWAAQLGSWVPDSPAKRLAGTIKGIQASIGTQALQMQRLLAEHGGGMGNVPFKEFDAITKIAGNLDQTQGADDLITQLNAVNKHFNNLKVMLTQLKNEKRNRSAQYVGAPPAAEDTEEEDTNPFQMEGQ